MPMKDGFTPDDPAPLFISKHADIPQHADEFEQQDMGEAWDTAVISPWVLKTSILVLVVATIGFAILWMGNPATLFTDVTASLFDKSPVDTSAPQPGSDPSTPTVQSTATQSTETQSAETQPIATQPIATQSTADAQAASPPVTKDAPSRDEVATASVAPSSQSQSEKSQTENSGESSEALFKQFQAWAAERNAQARAEPVKPVQDAPVQVAQNDDRAPVQPMQRHRRVRPAHDAQAEIRHVEKPRAKLRREQNAGAQGRPGVQARPVQDARAQEQPAQNAQAPSFLDVFRGGQTQPPQR